MPGRFPLGRTVITPGALEALSTPTVLAALHRHLNGDWGDLDAEDKAANERALVDGTRLLSAYRSSDDIKFWIITEADRSVTTILLPSEY